MYLIVALCLLCSWVAPHACRSIDTHEPPSEDLEPFMSHHHHEGNIAELLIPLLERSLAQSEARDNERAHRRSKGKKVIQVLPYRGSEEHERKGWRKLNSRKKQVVEITPLHGKNGAKPLAYILSAAKPKHADHAKTNDDVSSSNTSELEHDKSTSEEQQSSEEKENSEDINANTLRAGDDIDSRSASSNVQSSEDANSKESKDLSASDKESDEATVESDATVEKSEEKNVVVVQESEDDAVKERGSVQRLLHDHLHNFVIPASEEAATVEEDGATVENKRAADEDVAETVENAKPYSGVEDKDAIIEDNDSTIEADATVEAADVSAESRAATIEDVRATVEDETDEERAVSVEDVEVTVEDRAVTVEDVEVTVEDKAATIEEELATVEDNATVEGKTGASEDDVAVTVEDQLAVEDDERAAATIETDATVEDATVERPAAIEDTRRNVVTDIPDIYNLLKHHQHTGRAASVENEDSVENDQGYIENDIVISRGHHESNSAEKSINNLFNARARDIIELIQSSVEASTATQRDCLENAEKHHDHKSYRLSFLFNK